MATTVEAHQERASRTRGGVLCPLKRDPVDPLEAFEVRHPVIVGVIEISGEPCLERRSGPLDLVDRERLIGVTLDGFDQLPSMSLMSLAPRPPSRSHLKLGRIQMVGGCTSAGRPVRKSRRSSNQLATGFFASVTYFPPRSGVGDVIRLISARVTFARADDTVAASAAGEGSLTPLAAR